MLAKVEDGSATSFPADHAGRKRCQPNPWQWPGDVTRPVEETVDRRHGGGGDSLRVRGRRLRRHGVVLL